MKSQLKLMITIVVNGQNIMGNPLVEFNGVLMEGGKKTTAHYGGPITSAQEVFDEVRGLFKAE